MGITNRCKSAQAILPNRWRPYTEISNYFIIRFHRFYVEQLTDSIIAPHMARGHVTKFTATVDKR